jgi:hypothetical protein
MKLKSSYLSDVSYSSGTLRVTFKSGGTYIYHGVSLASFASLLRSPSPGSFFARKIKPFHKFTKLPPAP